MRILGDVHLNQGQLKSSAIEHTVGFPTGPVAGRIIFNTDTKRVYACTETEGTPTWIPLTNEIDIQVHTQSASADVWTIEYPQTNTNMGVHVYDNAGKAIIPDEIDTSTPGVAYVRFGSPVAGKAILIHQATSVAAQGIGGVTVLDQDGRLKAELLPAISITDTHVVTSEFAMLSLTAQKGDVAVRSDIFKSFILKGDDASVLSNWQELLVPTSVNSALLAQSADKLSTARTIALSGDVSGSTSFDGTTNVAIVATVSKAPKLSTARAITLTGDVTGTVSFDGSADVSIATTIKGEVVNDLGSVSGNVTVNYANGSYQVMTITGPTNITFSGFPDSTRAYGLTLEIINGGSNVSFPGSVAWLGNTPTLKASGTNLVSVVTRNGGTALLGSSI